MIAESHFYTGVYKKQPVKEPRMKKVKIIHKNSNTILAEGPLGWGITQFEGNFYCQSKYIKSDIFKSNFIPGICIYKFLYFWVDLVIEGKVINKNLAWIYWLPNPLLPFIWFRMALPGGESELEYVFSDNK